MIPKPISPACSTEGVEIVRLFKVDEIQQRYRKLLRLDVSAYFDSIDSIY